MTAIGAGGGSTGLLRAATALGLDVDIRRKS